MPGSPKSSQENPFLSSEGPGDSSASVICPTQVRWQIVGLLMSFAFLGHFNRVSISVAGSEVLTREGGISNEQMGWVYSAFLIVYTAGMLPGGWLIDRLGPRIALTAMGLGMGFCVVLTGVLGWTGLTAVSLWISLLVIRGIAGGFSVPLHPGAARSVSLWVPLRDRATANGLVTAGALIGISVTYPGFGYLMDLLEWPRAFMVSGGLMMVFSLVWYVLSTDDASTHRRTNEAEKQLVGDSVRSITPAGFRLSEFTSLFLNRGLLLLATSYAAYSYFQYLFFYWIGHYFEKTLELPVAQSRRASFIVMMAMAAGMAGGGFLTDVFCRWFGRNAGCRGMAILGMLCSAVCAWLGIAAKSPEQVVIYFSIALASLGVCEGIFWTTAPLLAPDRGGMAGAFLNTLGNAGGLLAPIFTPMIGERYGWPAAIGVACVVCGFGALLWLTVPTKPPQQKQYGSV